MTYEPIMVPGPRPNQALRTVLIVVGALLAVCCVVGACVGLWLYRSVKDSVEPARAAATAFLDDVQTGNHPGAYGRLCDRVRDTMTQEDFARAQAAQLKISSYEITNVDVKNYNGRLTATATVEAVQETTGAQFSQALALVKEDGEWRVCR
ncbi:Rv0361 family membrane protein [Micromonospora sp. CPCC 205558]|uniref:Rv0361 family membrane protein n=1 Tax=Micromonospora sp. CPCC 205558 TaxID=3122403 RepID=UPI002FEE9B57